MLSTVPENIYFGSVTALENLPNNDARPIPEPDIVRDYVLFMNT